MFNLFCTSSEHPLTRFFKPRAFSRREPDRDISPTLMARPRCLLAASLLLSLVLFARGQSGYTTDECEDLIPPGLSQQNRGVGDFPYLISVATTNGNVVASYRPSRTYIVSLLDVSVSKRTYVAFLLQARADTSRAIGRFAEDAVARTLTCSSVNDSVTNRNITGLLPYSKISVMWKAPDQYTTDTICFTASVVDSNSSWFILNDTCISRFVSCSPSPCQNGGNCSVVNGTFHCACPYSYLPPFCETKSSCLPNPCANGGSCVSRSSARGFYCQCSENFAGEICQSPVPYSYGLSVKLDANQTTISWNSSAIAALFNSSTSFRTISVLYGISPGPVFVPEQIDLPGVANGVTITDLLPGFSYDLTVKFVPTNQLEVSSVLVAGNFTTPSNCSAGKYGSNCSEDCGCLSVTNVGTCNSQTGRCYCRKYGDNVNGLDVIRAPVVRIESVSRHSVAILVNLNDTLLGVSDLNYTVLFVEDRIDRSDVSRRLITDSWNSVLCTGSLKKCQIPYLTAGQDYSLAVEMSYATPKSGFGPSASCLSGVVSFRTKEPECPSLCDCTEESHGVYPYTGAFLHVNCSYRGLAHVPSNLSNATTHLNLAGNSLGGLDPLELMPLTSLLYLNLSNAGLGRLGNEPFKGLNIAILDLSHNSLSDDDLLCVSFQGMNPTLTYLYLQHNDLNAIETCKDDQVSGAKKAFSSLIYIDLSHCDITQLSTDVLELMPNLLYLYLQFNSLSVFPTVALRQLKDLTVLDVGHNDFTSVDADAFSADLSTLYLNDNQIRDIPSGAFTNAKNLYVLDLSNNNLQSFDKKLLFNLTYLSQLNLRGNGIRFLAPSLLSTNPYIRTLDISNNGLAELDPRLFHGLTMLGFLYCDGNAFNCDCAKTWAYNFNWTINQVPVTQFNSSYNCSCTDCKTTCPADCDQISSKLTCRAITAGCSCIQSSVAKCPNFATLDTCGSSPCMNGGSCTILNNRYKCICPFDYDGQQCETKLNCQPNPCLNHGRCYERRGGRYSCFCKDGYAGDRCEIEIPYDYGISVMSLSEYNASVSWDIGNISRLLNDSVLNSYLSYGIKTQYGSLPKVGASVSKGASSAVLTDVRPGFEYVLELTVILGGSKSATIIGTYTQPSDCPTGTYGKIDNCTLKCPCSTSNNVGSCDVDNGQCFCQNKTADAIATSVIRAPLLRVIDVGEDHVNVSIDHSQFPGYFDLIVLFFPNWQLPEYFANYWFNVNCTGREASCRIPHLSSGTKYSLAVQATYSRGQGLGVGECVSGAVYTTTTKGFCPKGCVCNEGIGSFRGTTPSPNRFYYVDCSNQSLKAIPSKFSPKTTHLFLDRNAITSIPSGAFDNMPFLILLNLSRNGISKISGSPFAGLSLGVLDLSSNKLPDGQAFCRAFTNLTAASLLNLQSNSLTDLNCNAVGSFVYSIRQIDLSYNMLKSKTIGIVRYSNRLSSLKLRHNAFDDVPTSELQAATDLAHLDLSHNSITFIGDKTIPNSELGRLYLQSNKISRIDSGSFRNMTRLLILDLSYNSIAYLHAEMFVNCTYLQQLSLAENQIQYVPPGLFSDNQLMSVFDISNNSVSEVDPRAFVGPYSIRTLNCEGNPFNCDCVRQWALNSSWTKYRIIPTDLAPHQCACHTGFCTGMCRICSRARIQPKCRSVSSGCSCFSSSLQHCPDFDPIITFPTSRTRTTMQKPTTSSPRSMSISPRSSRPSVFISPSSSSVVLSRTDAGTIPATDARREGTVIATQPSSSSGGASPAIYAGVGVGLLVVIAVIIIVVYCLRKKSKRVDLNEASALSTQAGHGLNEYSSQRVASVSYAKTVETKMESDYEKPNKRKLTNEYEQPDKRKLTNEYEKPEKPSYLTPTDGVHLENDYETNPGGEKTYTTLKASSMEPEATYQTTGKGASNYAKLNPGSRIAESFYEETKKSDHDYRELDKRESHYAGLTGEETAAPGYAKTKRIDDNDYYEPASKGGKGQYADLLPGGRAKVDFYAAVSRVDKDGYLDSDDVSKALSQSSAPRRLEIGNPMYEKPVGLSTNDAGGYAELAKDQEDDYKEPGYASANRGGGAQLE